MPYEIRAKDSDKEDYKVMGFVYVNIAKEIENERKNSPEFNKAWEESRDEYRLIREMISIRKKNKITQSKLAEIT